MALLSAMLDRVHDEYPAVPEPVALRALSDSVKEFCERTHCWQEALSAVRVRPGSSEFELSPDEGVMVVALKEVRTPAGLLVPPYAGELTRLLVTPISAQANPLGYIQRTPSVIELVNEVAAEMNLSVKAALTVAQGQTEVEIPDDLVNQYAESLAAGAKMRLVRQPSQPWYAPDAAAIYGRDYYYCVNNAKRRVLTSLGEADLRVEMRNW